MNSNVRRDLSEELWRPEGTSLEFCRTRKKAHEARAGWMRETAEQDRVREVIMGWVMQSLIIRGWCYCQCDRSHWRGGGSVQFSRSVVSNSLLPHEPQHAGLPIHHQLPEFTQMHGHRVGDATQPSPPLSSPSHPALNLSQHQGLFKWVSSPHQVAKLSEFELQHQSFQWMFRTAFL